MFVTWWKMESTAPAKGFVEWNVLLYGNQLQFFPFVAWKDCELIIWIRLLFNFYIFIHWNSIPHCHHHSVSLFEKATLWKDVLKQRCFLHKRFFILFRSYFVFCIEQRLAINNLKLWFAFVVLRDLNYYETNYLLFVAWITRKVGCVRRLPLTILYWNRLQINVSRELISGLPGTLQLIRCYSKYAFALEF